MSVATACSQNFNAFQTANAAQLSSNIVPKVPRMRRIVTALVSGVAIACTTFSLPALADPFRTTNPRAIDANTEAAFRALFVDGDYQRANTLLRNAQTTEPLAYAIRASLAYLDQDWDALSANATRTRETAEQLVRRDPLRGHIYIAAGYFLEGAYTVATSSSTVAATPTVLSNLQEVFDNLDQAAEIAPNDPELNLIKGYMDLLLAVNLPFTSPNQAIERLESYAAPSFLVDRGLAIGYRDLEQLDNAIAAVDRALVATPNNPDLLYLKAQILVRQGKDQQSLEYFQQALTRESQLPQSLANQIAWEECRANNRSRGVRDRPSRQTCNPLLVRVRGET